jgi:hypothetical protein
LSNLSFMYRTIFTFLFLCLLVTSVCAQTADSRLSIQKGQEILIRMEFTNNRIQTAGAQVINFRLNGFAVHKYTVTDVTANSIKLHHEIQQTGFSFDGMGQKKNFDSGNEEDQKGPFAPYFKEILSRKFDITIDTSGRTIVATPEKTELSKPDDKLVTITDMLKPIIDLVYPPTRGSASFFHVLPAGTKSVGSTWTETTDTESEKSTTGYTISSMTDSTITVDFKTTATCNSKTEMMGRLTKTIVNNASTGNIIVDRNTGLLKEKTVTTDTNGTTEAMGGTVPISGKLNVSVVVKR